MDSEEGSSVGPGRLDNPAVVEVGEQYFTYRIRLAFVLGAVLSVGVAVALFGTCSYLTLRTGAKPYFCTTVWEHPPWVLLSGIAGAPALYFIWRWRSWNRQQEVHNAQGQRSIAEGQRRLTEEAQRSSRFAEAMRLLSEQDKLEARFGAVFALEHLAREGGNDLHKTVLETLSAFIRERSRTVRHEPEEHGVPPADIQAALTVLGRIGPCDETRAELTGAALEGAAAVGADFSNATLGRTNLSRAVLGKSTFRGAFFGESSLAQARLYSTDFCGSHLIGADLSGVEGASVVFKDASLANARFSRAKLRSADFRGADMTNANFTQAQLFDANFSNGDLSGADLAGAELSGADFRGANLSNAGLNGAQLANATYSMRTTFSGGFNPASFGMTLVDDRGNPARSEPSAGPDAAKERSEWPEGMMEQGAKP